MLSLTNVIAELTVALRCLYDTEYSSGLSAHPEARKRKCQNLNHLDPQKP